MFIKIKIKITSLTRISKKKMMSTGKKETREMLKKIYTCNFIFYEKTEKTPDGGKIKKMINPRDTKFLENSSYRKHIHGGSFVQINKNEIAFSFHTSKKQSKLLNDTLENIPVEEDLNIIKFTNPLIIYNIIIFNKLFKIDKNFNQFINSPRYGDPDKIQQYDTLYLALRAFSKCISSASPVYVLTCKDNELVSEKKTFFLTNPNSETFTPAEISLTPCELNTKLDKTLGEYFNAQDFINEINDD